jgi:hypothetical protein
MRWAVALLAVVEAGWMTFDGARALLVGDYVTPKTGTHAGQLGPWSALVRSVGIEPRSRFMKSTFVLYGLLWLIATAAFALKTPGSWWAMLVLATGSLWYLPIGTALGLIQIVLLFLFRFSPR